MSPLAFMSLSIGEMLVIAVAGLLVFGGRLPDVMRDLGRTYARFRHGMSEVAHPLRQEMRRVDVRVAAGTVPTISRRPAALEAPKEDLETGDDPAVADREDAPPPSAPDPFSGDGVADEPPPV